MQKLSTHAFAQAKEYIYEQGRALDQQRFEFHFEQGDAISVLMELVRYQNNDGGFGHGLEPDLRTPDSSAIATATAFGILREINAPASEPLIQRAVAYLRNSYAPNLGLWPIIPLEAENAPHAPWWSHAESEQNFGGFLVNPRAALVGYLHDYPGLVPASFLAQVTVDMLEHLATITPPVEMHELQCLVTLSESPYLPTVVRNALKPKLRQLAPHTVAVEPEKWQSYALPPLGVISSPTAFLTAVIPASAIAANLDFLIEQQLPDGSWPLAWNWAFVDEQAWAEAESDWKSHLALGNLLVLRAFGRLA